jgi:hypothetical protein
LYGAVDLVPNLGVHIGQNPMFLAKIDTFMTIS